MVIKNEETGAAFYTIEEYADALGYNAAYIRRSCKEGKITGAFKRRGAWLIPEATALENMKSDPLYAGEIPEIIESGIDMPLNLDVTEDDLFDDL